MILVTVNVPIPTSIRNANYSWTASAITGEYYLRTAAGGNPNLTEPVKILRNARYFKKGIIGSLVQYEYGYGSSDGLAYSTIYIRLYDGSDPDGKVIDSISAIYYDVMRCSNEALPLEHYWYPYAMSFGSIKYQIDNLYGGYCRLSYGSITFMPELFVDHWPPPNSLDVKVEYTATTEAASITLFVGSLHVKTWAEDSIVYDIYDADTYQINILQESVTNDSDQVSIRDANYKWTSAGAGNRYYLELATGGDPALSIPDAVYVDYVSYSSGVIGSLAVSQWAFGDVNSLGYDTIYIRLSDSRDPDNTGVVTSLAIATAACADTNGTYSLVFTGGGYTSAATGTYTILNNVITVVTITSGGAGYATAPTVATRNGLGAITAFIIGVDILAVYGVNPLPMAFGYVQYEKPVRLMDATIGGVQQYWLADIQGTAGIDWFLYDDGVDVSTNVSYSANNVFQIDVAPVGELTFSGRGSHDTLLKVFQWITTGTLTLEHTYDRAISPTINYYQTERMYIPDFLSKIVSWFTHLFYIRSGTLYLVDMLVDAGSEVTTEFDFFKSGYQFNSPAQKLTASYPFRIAGEWYDGSGGSAGVCLRESMKIISIESGIPYGDTDQDFSPPYCTGVTPITTALQNILTILNRPQVSISVPFGTTLQSPGKKMTWLNESYPYNIMTDTWVRSVSYDFDNNEITIEGDCVGYAA